MSPIPRYVSSAEEAAARIAGFVVGDGNPEHTDTPLGGAICFTALDTTSWTQSEIVRCATILGWLAGTHYRIASNGNVIIKRDALYTALGITSPTHDLYHRCLEPTGTFTPSRLQVEAFMASIIETEGSVSTNPPKVFDEARGGIYDQRIDALVLTMNTQSLGAFRSGNAVKCSLAALDAFPLPLISAARYPGDTPADWPDGPPPPPDTTPPSVPTGLAGVVGDGQVSLTWVVVVASDLAGYRLFRDSVLVYQGTAPARLDTGLTNGVTYSYQVASYDTTGNQSALSSAVSLTPVGAAATPPVAPTGLAGSPSATSVSLTWTASVSPDVVSHRVYRGSTLVATVSMPSAFYIDEDLDSSTVYTYRVTAVDSDGEESLSTDFISVTTLDAPAEPPPITQEPIQIVSSVGCPDAYEAFVMNRAGTVQLRELPFTRLTWSRVVDDVSTCEIGLDMTNGFEECCRAVNGLVPYGYEVTVYRDKVRVWTGPVVDIRVEGENITLSCEDKASWLRVRPIWSALDYPDPGEEIATIFNAVINNAMAPDNTPGLIPTAIATGVRAIREYTTQPPQLAYDAIQELSRTGVDWTMIGPIMVAGSFVVPASPIAYITDQALAVMPSLDFLGANLASQWFVTGDPEQNLVGTYGGADATYGLVVRIAQEDDIKDQTSLNQNAKSRWELTHEMAVSEATLVLDQTAPLPLELAVPGAVIDMRIVESCFPLLGQYRLKQVLASVNNSDDGVSESVSIVVEPLGTELIA